MHENIAIATPRLRLREFVAGDWEQVHRYASDVDVVRFMTWGPNTEEESRGFVQRTIEWQASSPRTFFDLAVTLKDGGLLIGSCGIHLARTVSEGSSQSIVADCIEAGGTSTGSYTKNLQAAMGYCYARESWGKGYASEAAAAMLRFGFESLELHKIYATCDVENIGSARVLEKIGMHREGHLQEDIKIKGRWRDSFLYAILQQQWSALNGRR